MKLAIVYATKTKHSKKIAEAIGAALEVPALDVRTAPALSDVDLLYVVGGIYGNKSLPVLLEYLSSLSPSHVKRAVLITSCCSKQTPQTQVRECLEQNGIQVLDDEFLCQGSFLIFGMGHPNQADLDAAVSFALQIKNQG